MTLLLPDQTAEPLLQAPPEPDRRRQRRSVVIAFVSLLVLLAIPAGAGLVIAHRLETQMAHMQGVFDGLPDRPSVAAAGAMNILLLGTDARSDVPTTGSEAKAPAWVPGDQRSDTLMVLHIAADRRTASVISIPRDSWVHIPGHSAAKINSAYSDGGPRLAVSAVEKLTNVRIDHVAIVDWDGYKALIQALGGIDVRVPKTVYDSYRKHTWTAGVHHLDGAGALLYARERSGLPGGDLDRVKRQQAVLRGLSRGVAASLSSPLTVFRLVDTLTRHLVIDSGWSIQDMAMLLLSSRHLRPADVDYLTIPTSGTGRVGDQSVVFVDDAASAALWADVRSDRMADWTSTHQDQLLGQTVR